MIIFLIINLFTVLMFLWIVIYPYYYLKNKIRIYCYFKLGVDYLTYEEKKFLGVVTHENSLDYQDILAEYKRRKYSNQVIDLTRIQSPKEKIEKSISIFTNDMDKVNSSIKNHVEEIQNYLEHSNTKKRNRRYWK